LILIDAANDYDVTGLKMDLKNLGF